MKHRRKSRFTDMDVNAICKLKDELIQDSIVHYVNRTIREWSEKLYSTNKEKKDD